MSIHCFRLLRPIIKTKLDALLFRNKSITREMVKAREIGKKRAILCVNKDEIAGSHQGKGWEPGEQGKGDENSDTPIPWWTKSMRKSI